MSFLLTDAKELSQVPQILKSVVFREFHQRHDLMTQRDALMKSWNQKKPRQTSLAGLGFARFQDFWTDQMAR